MAPWVCPVCKIETNAAPYGPTTTGGANQGTDHANFTDARWWDMITECRDSVVGRDRFIETIMDERKGITRKELKAYVQLLFKTYSSDQYIDRNIVSNIMLAYWKVTHDKNKRRKGRPRGRKTSGPGKPGSEYVIVENLGVHREAVLLIRSRSILCFPSMLLWNAAR